MAETQRINVRISKQARAMLEELKGKLYPTMERSEGAVVDRAIIELYMSRMSDKGGVGRLDEHGELQRPTP